MRKFVTCRMPRCELSLMDAHKPYSPILRALCLRSQAASITKNAYGDAVCEDGANSLQPDHDDE
jgi:L-lysine 2,3-aminomutase